MQQKIVIIFQNLRVNSSFAHLNKQNGYFRKVKGSKLQSSLTLCRYYRRKLQEKYEDSESNHHAITHHCS